MIPSCSSLFYDEDIIRQGHHWMIPRKPQRGKMGCWVKDIGQDSEYWRLCLWLLTGPWSYHCSHMQTWPYLDSGRKSSQLTQGWGRCPWALRVLCILQGAHYWSSSTAWVGQPLLSSQFKNEELRLREGGALPQVRSWACGRAMQYGKVVRGWG